MREDTWLVLERRQNALVAKLPSLTGTFILLKRVIMFKFYDIISNNLTISSCMHQ